MVRVRALVVQADLGRELPGQLARPGHGHQRQRHREPQRCRGDETARERRIARAGEPRLHPLEAEGDQEEHGEDPREDGVAEAEAGGGARAARERGGAEEQRGDPVPAQRRAADEVEAREEAQREVGEGERGRQAPEGAPHRPEGGQHDRVVERGQQRQREWSRGQPADEEVQRERARRGIVVAVVEEDALPVFDVRAEDEEIALERLPARGREARTHGRRVDARDVTERVGGEVAHPADRREGAELAPGHPGGLVDPRVAELGEVLGAHEVVEGLVPVDRALVVHVEEAEIRVGEGGGHGERHRDDAQPPRRRAAGGQPEEDPAEGEKEEEPERAEFLVGIQNVQKERMRRSTRSSWDWNGSLQRIVSRSGSLSLR